MPILVKARSNRAQRIELKCVFRAPYKFTQLRADLEQLRADAARAHAQEKARAFARA